MLVDFVNHKVLKLAEHSEEIFFNTEHFIVDDLDLESLFMVDGLQIDEVNVGVLQRLVFVFNLLEELFDVDDINRMFNLFIANVPSWSCMQ